MQKRKIPMRKCIVTQEMKPKKELTRIVRSKEGEVSVDPTGKKSGRGAYVTLDEAVIEKARKRHSLDQHLGAKVSDEVYEELLTMARRKELINGNE